MRLLISGSWVRTPRWAPSLFAWKKKGNKNRQEKNYQYTVKSICLFGVCKITVALPSREVRSELIILIKRELTRHLETRCLSLAGIDTLVFIFSDHKGPDKRGHIVADTLLPMMFLGLRKLGNICVGNNVSATMCPRLPRP